MHRIALVVCGVVVAGACKDTPAPTFEPAPAPTPPPVEDAAVPEPADVCFAIPFDMAAERAGIRRIAHHAQPAASAAGRVRDAVVLQPGTATLVPGLTPAHDGPALGVIDVGADALVGMARLDGAKVTLTAPAHLAGSVIEVRGEQPVVVAIGDAGAATLVRYRDHSVTPRLARAPRDGADTIASLAPVALLHDDLDGDGTLELVAISSVSYKRPARGTTREPALELGVLWASGELAFQPLVDRSTLYIASPSLSGGRPLVFSLAGDRIAVGAKTLDVLPAARGGDGARCLQTSASTPAELVARP